jgi:ABC-type proline/glycine betaine transport system ATPase subunit
MIRIENLAESYDAGRVNAVDNLSLSVAAGEFMVHLGESGCGKTTTLKMINRLVEPSAGRIEVDGEETGSIDAVMLRRRIGYVFQGVARALAGGPKIVLMDEPFGAVDPLTRGSLQTEYRPLHDEPGLTTPAR